MAHVFDRTIDLLSTALDLQLVRHNVITDNIANAETPGFKARRVEFEQLLKNVVRKDDQNTIEAEGGIQRSLSSVKPIIYEDLKAEVGQDRNTVDMDREMATLAKNDVKYTSTVQALSKKFALLKYAIMEGSQ